jgi:methionyl-tRNA formyltransferase
MEGQKIVVISHNFLGFRALKKMVENKFHVALVIGRSRPENKIISDYCGEFAGFCKAKKIPFMEVGNINDPEAMKAIAASEPHAIIVLGWSQIIKDELFSIPKLGIFGSHPSLLPKNRGNAAIPWQIINNEKESGLSLFKFEPGKPVDSGDIYAQKRFALEKDETAKTFYEKAVIAAESIVEHDLHSILSGLRKGTVQDESQATYLPRRKPEDGLIDWNKDADYIYRFVRAVGDPYPGAFTFYKGERITIIRAESGAHAGAQAGISEAAGTIISIGIDGILVRCGNGALEIKELSGTSNNRFPFERFKAGQKFTDGKQ